MIKYMHHEVIGYRHIQVVIEVMSIINDIGHMPCNHYDVIR